MKNQTVEQILNLFQQSLEEDALFFIEEARRVAEYDAICRDGHRDLETLTQQAHRCGEQQAYIEQSLTAIGEMEKELDQTLGEVEVEVDELFNANPNLPPTEADRQREEAYNTGMYIDSKLASLEKMMQQCLDQMDEAEERVFQSDSVLGPIVRDLLEHQRTLRDLEQAGQTLDAEISQVKQLLQH